MPSTMHWPYLGVIIVQKIPSESLQYNSTTVFMTCNEMAATVSCRHGSHTQVSTLPYPPTGQSPCISMLPIHLPLQQKDAATSLYWNNQRCSFYCFRVSELRVHSYSQEDLKSFVPEEVVTDSVKEYQRCQHDVESITHLTGSSSLISEWVPSSQALHWSWTQVLQFALFESGMHIDFVILFLELFLILGAHACIILVYFSCFVTWVQIHCRFANKIMHALWQPVN